MRAEIIAIGTELLLGHIVNTNAVFLSRKLSKIGVDVYYHSTVGDNPKRLAEAISQALQRSDIVITSGGLGPTVDDITAETLKGIVNKKPFQINNKFGTAPGLIVEHEGKIIVCLPGPPRELEPMFVNDVMPYLKKRTGTWILKSRTIKTTGLPESRVNVIVKDILNLKPPTTVGIYAKLGEVDLRIMAKADNESGANLAISKVEKKIRARLKDYIFGYDNETLEDAVAKILIKKKATIAAAESCTGGIISNRLTNVSGSSKYFIMGLVAYSNEVKANILGVSPKSIRRYGAVSRQVAVEMARGVKFLAGVNIGISVTGIAGPTGAAKKKPVGLVYIALTADKKQIVKEFRFKGSREEIKFRASQAALDLLRRNM